MKSFNYLIQFIHNDFAWVEPIGGCCGQPVRYRCYVSKVSAILLVPATSPLYFEVVPKDMILGQGLLVVMLTSLGILFRSFSWVEGSVTALKALLFCDIK